MYNKAFLLMMASLLFASFASPARAQQADPCPEAVSALSSMPDDLSKVQADIDRFTLCVERAQLLKRLNDLALENEQNLQGINSANPGFALGGGPENNFPTFDRDAILGMDEPQQPYYDEYAPDYSENTYDGWAIVNIFGVGSDLQAKLSRSDGERAQVREGDKLEDGTKVVKITPVSIEVSEKGKTRLLSWLEGQ